MEEEGIDLNADADTDDKVLFLHDVTAGAPTNLGLASGGSTWVLSMSDEVLAFRTRESDQDTTDLNGDGDLLDYVGHLHDLSTGLTTNLELATETIAVAETTVAFRVNESQQGGADLNGDGDASDAVLFVTMLPLFADGFETGKNQQMVGGGTMRCERGGDVPPFLDRPLIQSHRTHLLGRVFRQDLDRRDNHRHVNLIRPLQTSRPI